MKRLVLNNPDTNRIYHCWHYCPICGKSFDHSQGSFENIKYYSKCCFDNYRTVPNDPINDEISISI